MPDPSFLSPAAIAARLGLAKPTPVLAWIRNGELKASNVGTNPSGRPTWRIAEADFDAFVERRRAVPAPAVERRVRRTRLAKVTAYF
jgi:excisionase family DNA binding protein